MKKIFFIFVVIIVLMLGLAIWEDRGDLPFVNYQVLETHNDYEIRQYPELLILQNEVDSAKDFATNNGFSVLTNYVHGDNDRKEKINILLPVMQRKEGQVWWATFVVSNKYTAKTLPKPHHPHVHIAILPAKKYIVVRFSGVATQAHVERHLRLFQDYIAEHKIKVMPEPIIAFYNPPWTLPFIRRNEIMFALAGK